jgi:hypothetical protein
VPSLKLALAEFRLYSGQLALQDGNQKIPASACRFQETRVNALGLALDEIEHFIDEPTRRKNLLPVIGNATLGFDQIHFSSKPELVTHDKFSNFFHESVILCSGELVMGAVRVDCFLYRMLYSIHLYYA